MRRSLRASPRCSRPWALRLEDARRLALEPDDVDALEAPGGETIVRRRGGRTLGAVRSLGRLDMWSTCSYAEHMSKMIQIRNVPEKLHGKLKARAALCGMTLSDYLLAEMRAVAERPTPGELLDRLHGRTKMRPRVPPAKAIRAERDRR